MSVDEAQIALENGADMLGFVSQMPSGPGVIPLRTIEDIIQRLPPSCKSVLLTSATEVKTIVAQQKRVRSWGVQLVDMLDLVSLERLRSALPDVKLIQVVHVLDESALVLAAEYEPFVDFLLLDSGQPNAARRSLGGTGEVHNWSISQKICRESSKPVLLAGGLNSENVASALGQVNPDGVDLCSGIRSSGELSTEKLKAFVAALRPGLSDKVRIKPDTS